MKVVVIYKWAADPQNATVSESGVIDWGTKRAISEYDPVAIRMGRLFVDAYGGELIGLTAGDNTAKTPKATQAAAARGLDSLFVIADDDLQNVSADVYARALSAAIKEIGDVDLIIAGDASADVGGSAVPGLLAGYLGIPHFAQVTEIQADDATTVRINRHYAGGMQSLRIKNRAVLSVTTDAASIPLIGMKDMMAARKKPVTIFSLSDLSFTANDTRVEVLATKRPEVKPRKHIIFDSDDAARDLIAALREDGVLEQ